MDLLLEKLDFHCHVSLLEESSNHPYPLGAFHDGSGWTYRCSDFSDSDQKHLFCTPWWFGIIEFLKSHDMPEFFKETVWLVKYYSIWPHVASKDVVHVCLGIPTYSRAPGCHSTPGCLYLPFLTQHEKKRYCFHSVYLYHGGTVPVQKRSHFKERQDTEDLSKLCGSTSLVVAVVPYTSPFPSAPPMVSILDLTAWFPEVRFTAIPVTCLRRIA